MMTSPCLNTLALLGAVLGCATSAPALAAPGEWQVSKVSGSAWVNTIASRRELMAGTMVQPGETVVTGERSRVLLLRGTETMVVGPVSVLAVAERSDAQLSTTVLQKGGTVTFDVEKRNVQHFSVETPMLAAVVKGTHFTVMVGRTNGDVSVDRGTVRVTALASGQSSNITAGQAARVGPHGLSLSGIGRRAAVTVSPPRPSIVSQISEVNPATTVSAAELAAATSSPASAPSSAPPSGLFAAVGAAISSAASASNASGGVASTSSSSSASSGQRRTQSTTGSAGAAGIGTPSTGAASGSGTASSSNAPTSAAAASSGQSSSRAASSGAPSAAAASGNASAASAASAATSGKGSSSSPSNTSSASSPGSNASGKSDNGKGNAGTPGNGGANSSSAASGNSGKSDNGKGNGGMPGNGGANKGGQH